jgi:pyruvate carboxylase
MIRHNTSGFPHRGFPAELVKLVLKGNSDAQFSERAGLMLPPVDFEANIAALSAKHGTVRGRHKETR